MLLDGDYHLGQPIVHLIGDPAPLLLLGHHELAEQLPEPALALGKLRGTLHDPLFEGVVEVPDFLFGQLALGDVTAHADQPYDLPAAVSQGHLGRREPPTVARLVHDGLLPTDQGLA